MRARHATVDLLTRYAPVVKHLLTPEQRRKLPPFVSGFLEPRYLASIRNGINPYTGMGGIPGGGIMLPSGGVVTQGGGGTVTVRVP